MPPRKGTWVIGPSGRRIKVGGPTWDKLSETVRSKLPAAGPAKGTVTTAGKAKKSKKSPQKIVDTDKYIWERRSAPGLGWFPYKKSISEFLEKKWKSFQKGLLKKPFTYKGYVFDFRDMAAYSDHQEDRLGTDKDLSIRRISIENFLERKDPFTIIWHHPDPTTLAKAKKAKKYSITTIKDGGGYAIKSKAIGGLRVGQSEINYDEVANWIVSLF